MSEHSVEYEPCPDPDCVDGTIVVHDAYSNDPLTGEKQICDTCQGFGFVLTNNAAAFC